MKLLVHVEISHDTLTLESLMASLPLALESVALATGAGVAETGPHGMAVSAPGGSLAKVRFKLSAQETVRRIEDGIPLAQGEHAP